MREELREVCDEEFVAANAPNDRHGEVDSGNIAEKNEGECDGKVEVGGGGTIGGVVGNGIGGATNTPDSVGEE